MKLNRHQTDKWDDLHRQFFRLPTVFPRDGTSLASHTFQKQSRRHEEVGTVAQIVLELKLIFLLQPLQERKGRHHY